MLQLKLDRKSLTHLTVVLTALNILFITGMAVFVSLWERRDSYGPSGRYLIERVLVQFHLGTENVVAAWYSSMLLLLVTLACSDPPEGRCHWTLQLLADELVALDVVETVSTETVCSALQKSRPSLIVGRVVSAAEATQGSGDQEVL